MPTANKTTEGNVVVVIMATDNLTVNGNVIIGNGNTIVENGSQLNKTVEKKSALGELFNKVGKIIVNIVSKIKTMFLPRV